MSPKQAVFLRRAGWRDLLRLYRWRNHPSTREQMRTTDPVRFRDHWRWFRETRADPTKALFIVLALGKPVGTTRIDYRHEGVLTQAEITVTIAPKHRGRGLGTGAIRAVAGLATYQAPVEVYATIRAGNLASTAAFVGAGFEFVEVAADGYIRLRYAG